MAWGMNEMSACCRGLIINCMLWATCPAGGLLGLTSARYWRVIKTLRVCISPPCHLGFLDNRDNSSLDSGCGHGLILEVTGCKQWPLPMILFPSLEPHAHGCNVSSVIIFSDALELKPPGQLHHILGFILNPWDNTHQRRLCVPH